MAKSPAVLFYTSDFLSGVADLTMEERGQYITLLCIQHQKGDLSEKTICLSVGSASVDVMAKFVRLESGLYRNQRMHDEIEKRHNFEESRRINGSHGGRPKASGKPYANHMHNHMGNLGDNGNEDEDEDEDQKKIEETQNLKDAFERIRKSYPGTKKGFSQEWTNFERKNRKRLSVVLPLVEVGVERYKAQIASQGTEKRFIKHFSTWLNQECWTEEPAQGGTDGTAKPNHKSTLSDRLGAQARRMQEQVRRIDGQSAGIDYQDVDIVEPGDTRRPGVDRGDVSRSYPPVVQDPFGNVG